MTRDRQLEIAVAALRDISQPLKRLKRNADLVGHTLNAYALQIAQDPNHLKGLALEALLRMGRKVKP